MTEEECGYINEIEEERAEPEKPKPTEMTFSELKRELIKALETIKDLELQLKAAEAVEAYKEAELKLEKEAAETMAYYKSIEFKEVDF